MKPEWQRVPSGADQVCDPGPYHVASGETRRIPLNVVKGDRVRGTLVELDGRDFDWYIVDHDGLAALLQGEDLADIEAAAEGLNASAGNVSWRVRRDGPWYLVLDIYGRSAIRKVEVDLRRFE